MSTTEQSKLAADAMGICQFLQRLAGDPRALQKLHENADEVIAASGAPLRVQHILRRLAPHLGTSGPAPLPLRSLSWWY